MLHVTLMVLCLGIHPCTDDPAEPVPLPIRFEVIHAPPGYVPTGEVIRAEQGLATACMVFLPGENDRPPERNMHASVLWEVEANQFHDWHNKATGRHIERAQPTADEHAMLLRLGSSRLAVWKGMWDERYDLKPPKNAETLGCWAHTMLPDGRVIGQVALAASQRGAAVWDAQGKLTVIEKEGFQSLHTVDASGEHVIGDAWPVMNENLTHYAFAWHADTGTTILPLPEGSSNATGCAVNAEGLVLLSARFYENEERGADRWFDRPFLWTAERGLVPLPYPEGHSARALGMNEKGQVLMECFDPDDVTADNDDARASRHYCIVTIDGRGPVRLPHAFEDASRYYTHQALGDSGAVGVHAVWYRPSDNGGRTAIKHRGAVLVPVYADHEGHHGG